MLIQSAISKKCVNGGLMSYWLQIVHTSLKYHHGWKGVVFDAHLLKTVAYKRHICY